MPDDLLSACLIAYVGEPGRPGAGEERVATRVGPAGMSLVPTVRSIMDEVHAADPPLWNFADLGAVADAVHTFLRARHPELSAGAVQAVVNRFTYDWK